MKTRVKYLSDGRRPIKVERPLCPICAKEMTRKGKTVKDLYFKCKKCGGTLKDGQFREKLSDLQRLEFNREIVMMRKKVQLTKMIKALKREKYLSYKSFEWDGKIINLDDYDKDGVSIREKKELEQVKEVKEGKKEEIVPEVVGDVVQ